jgi:negative regulator of sigma E activity
MVIWINRFAASQRQHPPSRFFDLVSPQPWSDCMQKLTAALCVALFALSGTASYAADEKKAEPAKQTTAKPADNAASAAPAKASAPAAKKEKKGGC